jgi:hypothetical protein
MAIEISVNTSRVEEIRKKLDSLAGSEPEEKSAEFFPHLTFLVYRDIDRKRLTEFIREAQECSVSCVQVET